MRRPPTKKELTIAMYQKGIAVDLIAELLQAPQDYVRSTLAMPEQSAATLAMAYRHDHPDTLALYCSDGRFTRAVEELCDTLGADRIDTITIPGGPGLLDIGKLALSDRATVTKSLGFLVQGHQIKTVVLVAHAGCGYYRNRYPRKSATEVEAMQYADLRAAREYVQTEYKTKVHCYYARVEDNQIAFYGDGHTG